MRAVVVGGPGEFGVRDLPVPDVGPFEVLCRVRAATLCGTDTHLVHGDYPGFWPPSWPHVLGHEWSGEIVEVAPESSDLGWKVGTRVAGTSLAACGYCARCVEGRYNLCMNYGDQRLHRQYGLNSRGALAEYAAQNVKSVFAIPDEISYDEAALLDPAAIAFHTAKRGRVSGGETAVVLGAGVMGLLVAQCARALGAARVIVVGHGSRLSKASELGTEVIDATGDEQVERIRSVVGGGGPDVIFDCSGDPESLSRCVLAVRSGGRIAVTGIPHKDAIIPLRRAVLDEIDIVGVRAAAGEMPAAIALARDGRLRLGPLITHTFPLEEFGTAFETFSKRIDGALKVILHPS